MSNKVKDTDIKNRIYLFFKDMINVKNLYSNNIKIEKSHTKIFSFAILDM